MVGGGCEGGKGGGGEEVDGWCMVVCEGGKAGGATRLMSPLSLCWEDEWGKRAKGIKTLPVCTDTGCFQDTRAHTSTDTHTHTVSLSHKHTHRHTYTHTHTLTDPRCGAAVAVISPCRIVLCVVLCRVVLCWTHVWRRLGGLRGGCAALLTYQLYIHTPHIQAYMASIDRTNKRTNERTNEERATTSSSSGGSTTTAREIVAS
jgi:hypothetical protein